jgi:hypothetical protein
MDGVVWDPVFGKLSYPRTDWREVPGMKPNHKSRVQPEGTAVLGQKIATWPCQGEVAREGNKSLAD